MSKVFDKFKVFDNFVDDWSWELYVTKWVEGLSSDRQFDPENADYCGFLNVDPSCDAVTPEELWLFGRIIHRDPYVLRALENVGIEVCDDPCGFEEVIFTETEWRKAESEKIHKAKFVEVLDKLGDAIPDQPLPRKLHITWTAEDGWIIEEYNDSQDWWQRIDNGVMYMEFTTYV